MRITKQVLLDTAEIVDAFRVVPRAILVAYAVFVWNVVTWYMGIPTPTVEQAAIPGIVTGLIAAVIGLYQSSGRKWSKTGESEE